MDLGICKNCGDFEGFCKCGKGRVVVDAKSREKISKFLSGLLRHFGEKYGLKFDEHGWTDLKEVSRIISDKFGVEDDALRLIVEFDKKGRFEIENSKIRAKYGHSFKIDVDWSENGEIPSKLYHGTHPKNVESILKEGLKPMRRMEVHLSPTVWDAVEVGRRYAKNPAVLEIDAKNLLLSGFKIRKKGKVYTLDFVPPKYIRVLKI